jgi:hypothetical protein
MKKYLLGGVSTLAIAAGTAWLVCRQSRAPDGEWSVSRPAVHQDSIGLTRRQPDKSTRLEHRVLPSH